MKTKIVVGLGFGDEGKGLTTDYLCQQAKNPIVIRFNGGHQAGHTVVTADGKRHVFSSFGSGSLRGVPTYWSRYCTFYPIGFLNEFHALEKLGFQPRFYLDYLSPVTTFYDVIYNRALEESRSRHGSCGLGFGATIERQETFPKLFAQDLFFPQILVDKLKAIASYYDAKIKQAASEKLSSFYYDHDFDEATKQFLEAVQSCRTLIRMVREKDLFTMLKEKDCTCIFEGAQGILLDMDFGFFPHVTRSNTTSRNAIALIKRHQLPDPVVYYVTRSYQTRHGAGPMTNEHLPLELDVNEWETNVLNQWQGNLRKTVLDIDLLRYALLCDSHFTSGFSKGLVVTCLDQTKGNITATTGGALKNLSAMELVEEIIPGCYELLLSDSDISDRVHIKGLMQVG
jgi:adenylosuccinate synthase